LTGTPCCSIFLDGDGSGLVSQTQHHQLYVGIVDFVSNIPLPLKRPVKCGKRMGNRRGNVDGNKRLEAHIRHDRHDDILKVPEEIYPFGSSSSCNKNLVRDQLPHAGQSHFPRGVYRIPGTALGTSLGLRRYSKI
jgi:hypothetical protein